MKQCKLLIALLLAALCLMACAAAKEPVEYTSGDYRYVLLADGTVEITDYTGEAEMLTVPSMLDGYRVTGIGDHAFSRCRSLTSITLPDGLTSIGTGAFSACKSLTSITLPDGLTSIGDCAFWECTSLTSITLPDGLISIGDYAFDSCESLTSITLPDGLTSIGDFAFHCCNSLTSVTLPDGLTSIGDYAFDSCESLTSITLPDGLTSIGKHAFSCCSLTSITIPDSVTQIGSNPFLCCNMLTTIHVSPRHPVLATIDGVLFNKTEKKLICYPYAFTASTYAVPNGILSIGDRAFYCCNSLTSVTLPDSLTSIGHGAFALGPGDFTITVPMDSYAEQWCIDNNVHYTFPNANDWLLN